VDLKALIRDIPDFPTQGVLFRDITPLLRDSQAFKYVIDRMMDRFKHEPLDKIVAIESRGFLFGAPLAYQMGKGLVPVRKSGKLPARTLATEYSLEYGASKMEIHVDGIARGERVLLLDDLLATGGTLAAAARLVEMAGGIVSGIGLVIELTELKGRQRLEGYDIFSLVQY
jgi:adenine phosphoribosyltransferase